MSASYREEMLNRIKEMNIDMEEVLYYGGDRKDSYRSLQ